MENQHRKIVGYRELSQIEIDLMNDVKQKGEELRNLVSRISLHISEQHQSTFSNEDEYDRLLAANPTHWLTEGTHELQSGLMKVIRSIAQPTTF